jgi:hypothetical protein
MSRARKPRKAYLVRLAEFRTREERAALYQEIEILNQNSQQICYRVIGGDQVEITAAELKAQGRKIFRDVGEAKAALHDNLAKIRQGGAK